jgi:hypothetical protein
VAGELRRHPHTVFSRQAHDHRHVMGVPGHRDRGRLLIHEQVEGPAQPIPIVLARAEDPAGEAVVNAAELCAV